MLKTCDYLLVDQFQGVPYLDKLEALRNLKRDDLGAYCQGYGIYFGESEYMKRWRVAWHIGCQGRKKI